MRKYIYIILASIALLCSGCSSDYETVQEKYADSYQAHLDKDKVVNIYVEFETRYEDFDVFIFDTATGESIYHSKENFKFNFDAKYKGRYIFDFTHSGKAKDDEPYTWIHIKNTTDNHLIEEYEYEGCLVGYNNSFLAW
jgi:hypothetical protein